MTNALPQKTSTSWPHDFPPSKRIDRYSMHRQSKRHRKHHRVHDRRYSTSVTVVSSFRWTRADSQEAEQGPDELASRANVLIKFNVHSSVITELNCCRAMATLVRTFSRKKYLNDKTLRDCTRACINGVKTRPKILKFWLALS